jgi:hypothetical protein
VHRWGFQVGDVVVVVDGDGPASRQPPFEPRDAPTLRLTAVPSDEPLRADGHALHDADGWSVYRDGARLSFVLKSDLYGTPEFARVDLDPSGATGRLLFRRGLPVDPLSWKPLDELLVLQALARSGGLLMHAAGLAGPSGGLLLAGVSGAGKTTLSRALDGRPGALLLTDERAVVRPTPAGWVLDGTPWPGDGHYRARATVPLRGLMLLEQAEHDAVEPLAPARAMALLYRCHFPPFWSAEAVTATLDSLERLVREVPAFTLRNRLGGEAPRLCLERIS